MKLLLNKYFSIKNKDSFDNVYNGKKTVSDSFIIYSCENEEHKSRLAVVINRKYGSSVKRNSVRRQVKEYFRKFHNREICKDYVVIPKRNKKIILKELDNQIK